MTIDTLERCRRNVEMEVVDRKDCTIERELRDEVGGSGCWMSASAVRD